MADSTPLDKLEIEITSSSDTAVKKVNALAAALERLGNVASLRGVEDTAEKIKSIGNASETISVKVDKTSERSLNSLIGKVKALQQAISSVNATAINIPSISKNDGGNKKATEQKVPQSISASGTTERVSETIQEGKSSAEVLKNVKQNADDATASIRKMRKELSSQWSTWSSLGGMVHGVTEKVKDAAAASEKFSKALRYIIPVVGVITTAFRGVVSLAGKLWSVAKRIGSAFVSLASTIAGAVVGAVKKFASLVRSAAVSVTKMLGSGLAKGLKVVGTGLKAIGSGVLNYVTNHFKKAISFIQNWKKKLLSVAFYRAVRTALKMITDGFKEGMENLYLFSQQANTQFAPAMDSLASSGLYLKNSLGALAAPLIQAVAPAVEMLINLFVDLLNVVNAVFAALTGQSSYTKALYHAASWGEDLDKSMGGAAGSAKELKRYLIGIDELNVMPDQDTGGGGGGGGSLDTGNSNFEVAELPSELTDLAQRIKDAIANGDWYGAGQILAEKLNGIIENWDAAGWGTKLGTAVQNGLNAFIGLADNLNLEGFGGKIATLLSNALSEIDPDTLGGAMAEGIKSAFRFLEGFMQDYDGPNIGEYLARIVNGWFAKLGEVDENGNSGWTRAGKLINDGINGVINGVKDFIDNLDSSTIQKSFEDFFGEIKWGEILGNVKVLIDDVAGKTGGIGEAIGNSLGNILNSINANDLGATIAGVFESAINLVTGVVKGYKGPNIGKYLADMVNGWFESLSTLDKNGESAFTKAGKLVNQGINGIITGITDFINGLDSETIKTAFNQFFGEIEWDDIWENLKTLAKTAADKKVWKDMLSSLWTAVANIAIWIRDEILGISDEDAKKPWDSLKEKLENSAETITWTDALEALNALTRDIITTLIDLLPKDGWGDFWSDMKDKLATALGAENWEDLKDQLKKAMKDVWGDVMDSVYEAIRNQSGLIAGVLFPHRDEIDDAIEQYKKDFEKYGEDVANVNLSKSKLTSDEQSTIKDLYKRTGGEFTSTDVLSEQAWQGDFKIKVQAVIDKINTSSLSNDQKILAMNAVIETVNSADLSPEYKQLVMDAVVKTIDSTALTDAQRSVVMDAIIKTVNSKQLGIEDKFLVMTALLHAVDGTGLTSQDKKVLMNAELTGVIDAISPEKKIVNDAKAKYTGVVDGLNANQKTIEGGINIKTFSDGIEPEEKVIGGMNASITKLMAPTKIREFDVTARATDLKDDIKQEKKTMEFSATVKNESSTWWSNVQTWWNGKVGAVKSFTTNVTNQSSTWWSNVSSWWGAKVSSVKSFTTNVVNGSATWWSNVKTWWSEKVGAVKNFTTAVTNNAGTWWSNVKTWWANKSKNGVSFKAKITSFIDAIKNKVLTFKAKITSFIDSIKNKTLSFKANITGFLGNAAAKVRAWLGLSTGGIYTGGRWQPIAGYASGGNPRKARLFYANENGMPELVGQIGGHTAVMNNGQIVASVASGVYQAVSAAMGSVGSYFASIANGLSRIPAALSSIEPAEISPVRVWDSEPSYASVNVTARSDPRYNGADGMEESIRESNEGMINALYAVCQRVVTAINEKDTTITLDRQELGRSVTKEQNRMTTMYGKRMVEA